MMPMMAMPTTATEFVPMATASNTFEIESSRLALERSRDREVRRYARQMIADHTTASRRMVSAARSAGIPAQRSGLDAKHQRMLDELAATPSDEFDAAYVDAQVMAHREAVALFTAYSERGDEPRLQQFAANTLPTLQMHHQEIERLDAGGGQMMSGM